MYIESRPPARPPLPRASTRGPSHTLTPGDSARRADACDALFLLLRIAILNRRGGRRLHIYEKRLRALLYLITASAAARLYGQFKDTFRLFT